MMNGNQGAVRNYDAECILQVHDSNRLKIR